MRKEVEIFLQEELDKLLAEKEPIPESKELPRKTSQELRSSEKLRTQPKKLKFGVEKTRVEEDLLTLLDEPWDIPKDPTRGEVEDPWDNLSLLDESMLELKPLARQGGPSRLEEEEKISEEEEDEEKKKEGGRPLEGKEEHLVKMSAKEGQHLMKPVHAGKP
ncbi:hypothetical protein E2320_013883 [Naja naja]|nr:hypothetical protein E2320_013883 [Naja naja]